MAQTVTCIRSILEEELTITMASFLIKASKESNLEQLSDRSQLNTNRKLRFDTGILPE